MSKIFKNKKLIVFIAAAIITVILGIIVGTNVATSIKNKEKLAEKAKYEKTIAEHKETEEKIKKAQSDEIDEEQTYSEEYKEYEKLSDEEKSNTEVVPRKEKVDYKELEIIKEEQKEDLGKEYVLEEDKKESDNKEVLPKKYNLKDKINITVADQGQFGLCWDFASVKSVETNLAITQGKYINISESHIDYLTSNKLQKGGRKENCGGNFGDVKLYNDIYRGFVLEEEVPLNVYEDYEYNTFYDVPKQDFYITKYSEFPTIYRDDNMSQEEYENQLKDLQTSVKTHIMNYGSVYAVIDAPDYGKNHYVKYSDEVTSNRGCHAISIVGWDDNYSRNNFRSPNGNVPDRDGAYIALNSWGSDWGDEGYFYISYEDHMVHGQMSGVVSINDYSSLINVSTLGPNARKYVANNLADSVITINGREYLKEESIGYFIDLSEINITNLSEFEIFLRRAFDIDLSNCGLNSVDELAKYIKKDNVSINLSGNNIKDVSSLKNLKIDALVLDGNNGVVGYEDLNVSYRLSLANCGLTEFKYSEGLKNIEVLDLSGNKIDDFSALTKMDKVYYLSLNNCELGSLEKIKEVLKMKELSGIELINNKLTDISGLEDSTIYNINLSENPDISNFEPIRKLKETYTIILRGCNIKDAKDVYMEAITEEEIQKVKDVMYEDYGYAESFGVSYYLSDNKGITNLKALKNANELFIDNCDLGDISELKELKHLKYLTLSDNHNLKGDLSGMELTELTVTNCGLTDNFDLFGIKSVDTLDISKNNIKSIDKFANKVVYTIIMDSYDGNKYSENGPYIVVEGKFPERTVIVDIPNENGLLLNVSQFIFGNDIDRINVTVNGKSYRSSENIIPLNENTTIKYWEYNENGSGTVNVKFKVNNNLKSSGITVKYNPYIARLKDENIIDKANLVVANTYGEGITKNTSDFEVDSTNIYKINSRIEEREINNGNISYIFVPDKFYTTVKQGNKTAKFTVGQLSSYTVVDNSEYKEPDIEENSDGGLVSLTFKSEKLYNIAKEYWKGIYVRADDGDRVLDFNEQREENDSGYPMYIPRDLLYDVEGLEPMIVTDIYILMDMDNGMDRIEAKDLEVLEKFDHLKNIHIITPPEEYNQLDLIINQDKYNVSLEKRS